jgi:hypothetical protein
VRLIINKHLNIDATGGRDSKAENTIFVRDTEFKS